MIRLEATQQTDTPLPLWSNTARNTTTSTTQPSLHLRFFEQTHCADLVFIVPQLMGALDAFHPSELLETSGSTSSPLDGLINGR